MKRIIILALLALSACQTSARTEADKDAVFAASKPPTAQQRAAIVEYAKVNLVDPYSVRDAGITNVNVINPKTGYSAVCIRGNAKNRMGGYTGMSNIAIHIMDGKPVDFMVNHAGCDDPRFTWHPFPELEALRNN